MRYLRNRIAAVAIGAAAIAAAAAPAAVLGPHAEACAAGAGKPAMLVRVEGLKGRVGTVRVQSYGGNPDSYFEKGAYLERVEVRPPAEGAVEICLPVPRPGTYAVSVKHDVDGGSGGWSLHDGGGFSGNPNMSAMDALFKRKPSPVQVEVQVHGLTRVPITVRYLQGNP